jgi:two-component system sensor histidine kinase HydH
VLAHEIRNPLASLKGHAQLLAEALPEGEPHHVKAERVVTEAQRLEVLTTTLLEFVRTGTIHRTACPPADILRDAARDVSPDRIDIADDEAPATWSVDGGRMHQVLANVLRNAVQASPDGARVTAHVRAERDTLVYEVRDRGKGIDEGADAAIFEPFHTGRVHGTGLGLAVAKRVVELHGGSISAANHADGGAVFRMSIPRGVA